MDRQPPAEDGAHQKAPQRNEWGRNREAGRSSEGKSEQHDVARDEPCEYLSEAEVADCVHQPGREGEHEKDEWKRRRQPQPLRPSQIHLAFVSRHSQTA